MFLARQGRLDEATSFVERAKALDPELKDVDSFLLFSYNFRTDVDATTVFDEHRTVGAAIQRAAGAPFTDWTNTRDPDRRLRIGYVSGDYRHHPVALFLRPVLEHHDPQRVETFCYSNHPDANEVADALRARCRHWTNVLNLDDARFAELIRRDRIDVLVDLSGHTNGNRLPVFARHPAPVQVTWLGYLNTTGLPAMDYRICDVHTDPEGETEHLYTEHLVRMPHSQWCYAPWLGHQSLPAPRLEKRASVVFGSFNQYAKITDECLALWCKVLSRVPEASLLVLDVRQPETRTKLLDRMERRGVDPARVTTRGRQSIADYFRRHRQRRHRTRHVSLQRRDNHAGYAMDGYADRRIARRPRHLARLLQHPQGAGCGRTDRATMRTNTWTLNVRLARDADWRTRLRDTLRPRLVASPLMDAKQFATDLEARYREMWRAWCGREVRRA